jgi:L-threonylcarbamoyladenylate synthase
MPTTEMLLLDVPDESASIRRAAMVIRAGGLVAFPTETVYGLGADALSREAVLRIYRAKRRAADDPCIIHIADLDSVAQVADIGAATPIAARWLKDLADAFWPGPLSLIFPRGAAIPPVATAGRPTVAVRMPAHPTALALIRAAGVPIAAPSANIFMHTSPTTARHVWDDLAGRIDLILDGGPTPVGVESTVVDLTGTVARVLRPGGVSIERLRTVLGSVETGPAQLVTSNEQGLAAPGMVEKHYAPRAEVILLAGQDEAVRRELALRSIDLQARGVHAGALLTDEDAGALANDLPDPPVVAALGPAADAEQIARRLFSAMRELENQGVTVILARMIAGDGVAQAIRDRLQRAAGGRVIWVTE